MNKILLTVISVFVAIILVLLVVPSFISWNHYKDQIKAQVAAATGYKLELNGDLSAAILPYPHVTVRNMTVDSNGVEGPFAFQGQVDKASVSLAIFPLLSGNIAVSDITLMKPVITLKEQNYTPPATESSSEETTDTASSPAVQIDNLSLEDASITYQGLKGDPMVVVLPKLQLKADSLFGPYEFDGQVQYQSFDIGFNGHTGQYSKTDPMPVTISLDGGTYQFDYSGIADLSKNVAELQGEVSLKTDSIKKLAATFGSDNIPVKDQSFAVNGLLTGTAKALTLKNGQFSLGGTKGTVQFDGSNLDQDIKTITTALTFSTALNLDDILTASFSAPAQTDAAGDEDGENKDNPYAYLPATMELPASINAELRLSAPQITYQGRSVSDAVVMASLKNAVFKGGIKADDLPGGGSIDMNATLTAESTSRNGEGGSVVFANPALSVDGSFSVNSLKTVTADWLKLTESKTFDNPQMPQSATGQIQARIQGANARLSSPALSLGQYKLQGLAVTYKNAAEPAIDLAIADFEGAKISASGTLDQSQGVKISIAHPNAARFIKVFKPDFESTPNMQQSFAFDGTILKDGDITTIPALSAKIGDIQTTGTLSADTSGSVPSVTADLTFATLDTRALLTGEKSTPVKGTGANSSASAKPVSTDAPWTRDAIDTSFLRSFNLDLTAKAQQLIHGTWLINNPLINIDLKDGVMDINDISGGLFDGTVKLTGRVSAKQEGQPMTVTAKINADNVNLDNLVRAAMAQNKQRVSGTGSFDIDLTTSGLSSSALIYALNGDGRIKTSDLIVYGIDLAKVTEAISDESLSDLGTVIQTAFKSGQTPFKAVDHALTIREGTMPVENFTLESATAKLIANGEVSFARWNMNVTNTVDFIGEYDNLPSVDMTIKGPLNAPQQNVASDVLRSFLINKYGGKVQNKVDKLIGDKLGKDNPATGIINNILGLPQPSKTQQPSPAPAAPAAPAATPTNDPTSSPAPQSESQGSATPAPAPEPATPPTQQDQQPQQAPQQSGEEQLIRGLIDQLGR